MPIVFRVASVAGLVENGLLSLYSMRAAFKGGNHWQHMLFVLACDTARYTERETSNAADRKSCRWTERHSHSFPLNNIIAYLSQIIVNVHNDFTLGYKLCIVHFSAKRLSFCGSNTVCMLHIERSNTDHAFSFRLLCFFKHRTSNSFVPYSSFLKQTYVCLICLLNKQF